LIGESRPPIGAVATNRSETHPVDAPGDEFCVQRNRRQDGKGLEMAIVRGRAKTASASKYLQQLCRHWGHKFEVEFSETRGQVRFQSAVATMEASADALLVTIETDDGESVEQLKESVVRHLDRFAFREAPLPFEWSATSPS
jgi:hypothetical protein